jgi:hypothetical protein
MKDLNMQREMQLQAPYSFGIICSPYFHESTSRVRSDKQTYYFNCFRTREISSTLSESNLEALNVMCTINYQPIITPMLQQEMQKTLHTVYNETKEIFQYLKKKYSCCKHSDHTTSTTSSSLDKQVDKENLKSIYLTSQYHAFLFSFWKDSILRSNATLKQDIQKLQHTNADLKKSIDEKYQLLSQYITVETLNHMVDNLQIQDKNEIGVYFDPNDTVHRTVVNSHQFYRDQIEEQKRLEATSSDALLLKSFSDNSRDKDVATNKSTTTAAKTTNSKSTAATSSSASSSSSSSSSSTTTSYKHRKKPTFTLHSHMAKEGSGNYDFYAAVTIESGEKLELKDFISYTDRYNKTSYGQIVKITQNPDQQCYVQLYEFLNPDILLDRFPNTQFGEGELVLTENMIYVDIERVVSKVRVMEEIEYYDWKYGSGSQFNDSTMDIRFYCSKFFDRKNNNISPCKPPA